MIFLSRRSLVNGQHFTNIITMSKDDVSNVVLSADLHGQAQSPAVAESGGGTQEASPPVSLEFHPFAEIFPLMVGEAYEKFRDDIEANGLEEPIVTYRGRGLDGRNRLKACEELGIVPVFKEYEGDDPIGHIVSLNLHRRHLTESQKAMIALGLVNTRQGQRTDLQLSATLPKVRQQDAARQMKVSERLVRDAKRVNEQGSAEQIESVVDGSQSVTEVLREIRGQGAETVKPKVASKKQNARPETKAVADKPKPETPPNSTVNRTRKKTVQLKDMSWEDVLYQPAETQIQWLDIKIRKQLRTYTQKERDRLGDILTMITDDIGDGQA